MGSLVQIVGRGLCAQGVRMHSNYRRGLEGCATCGESGPAMLLDELISALLLMLMLLWHTYAVC